MTHKEHRVLKREYKKISKRRDFMNHFDRYCELHKILFGVSYYTDAMRNYIGFEFSKHMESSMENPLLAMIPKGSSYDGAPFEIPRFK
jgi:hypothetical protein